VHYLTVNTFENIQWFNVLHAVLGVHTYALIFFAQAAEKWLY
jgi:hypothetical protein